MRFVILAQERTGSSHLTDMLNNQNDILCNGEIFHPRDVYVHWPKSAKTPELMRELGALKASDPLGFLDRVMDARFDREHVGFKILEGQNEIALNHLLQDPTFLKVVLYRRNALATYSSKKLAHLSGQWDRREGKRAAGLEKIRFNAERFTKFHDGYVAYYSRLLASLTANKQPLHFINYEEINDARLLSALVLSIGGDPAGIRIASRHRRQNSSNIISRFSNPEDVEQFLMKHNLMQWAYEADTSLDPLQHKEEESGREAALQS